MAVRRGEVPPAREIPEAFLETELPRLQRVLEPHSQTRHQRPALPGTVSRPELHREPRIRGTRRSDSSTRHPSARHRTDQERANSTDKIPRRAVLIVKRLSCVSSDSGSCCCPGQGRRAAGGRPASWALPRPSPTPARSMGHAWRSRSMRRGCRRRSRPRRAARPWRADGGLRCVASPGRDQHLAVPGLYRQIVITGTMAILRSFGPAGRRVQNRSRFSGVLASIGYQPERSAFHHVLVTLSWSPVAFRHRSRYPARYGGDIDAGQLAWDPSPGRS